MLIERELKNSKDSISNIKDLNNDNFSNPSPLMRKNNNEANHKMINLKNRREIEIKRTTKALIFAITANIVMLNFG